MNANDVAIKRIMELLEELNVLVGSLRNETLASSSYVRNRILDRIEEVKHRILTLRKDQETESHRPPKAA